LTNGSQPCERQRSFRSETRPAWPGREATTTRQAQLGRRDAAPVPDRCRISLRKAAEKFRRAREDAGLTLRELAEKAGLAPSTVLKVERSQVVPSMAVCIRLADALNRKISYFVEEEDAHEDVRFVARGKGRIASARASRVATEVVAEPLRNPRMEAFVLTIQPGGESGREAPIVYRGEEIVFGLKGRVRFDIRGVAYVVRPGDTLHFKGDVPHTWANPGPGEAQILMACAFGYER
jgi:transcriptional regulator with XRE-family HTH domain